MSIDNSYFLQRYKEPDILSAALAMVRPYKFCEGKGKKFNEKVNMKCRSRQQRKDKNTFFKWKICNKHSWNIRRQRALLINVWSIKGSPFLSGTVEPSINELECQWTVMNAAFLGTKESAVEFRRLAYTQNLLLKKVILGVNVNRRRKRRKR